MRGQWHFDVPQMGVQLERDKMPHCVRAALEMAVLQVPCSARARGCVGCLGLMLTRSTTRVALVRVVAVDGGMWSVCCAGGNACPHKIRNLSEQSCGLAFQARELRVLALTRGVNTANRRSRKRLASRSQ